MVGDGCVEEPGGLLKMQAGRRVLSQNLTPSCQGSVLGVLLETAVSGDKGSRWRVRMRQWGEDEGAYMIASGFGNKKPKLSCWAQFQVCQWQWGWEQVAR